ncbi:glycyl-tRNA synthetase [Methanospirillum hungatei JF-1]|jgi:glycyl-tRNA synthetase|uniref:glycine--tRNA ligase n=1 Tax=Methanospirillum hungatei JF-1 (strain ATCC 27890 / DSM 864 / NBRC 100397 / JF-1) TaxID=323259 RepID=Q2FR06_METHJ|nr:glycine--tRNA ligase [Methanospirillum hungatei]ABD41430.1 glycyl-tRNA synthetase [Methanospirillum hungatei JF-1]
MSDVFDNVMDLAKRRGFVWPTTECYGSVAGFIDYGPLGTLVKRRIEDLWRQFYVISEGYYEIECPTIGQEAMYIASGHVKGFSDKMCQCPACNEYLRADHVAEAHNIPNAATLSCEALAEKICTLPCPACNEVLGKVEVFTFNLMFQTTIGPGSQRKGYLRPETAQGIFVDFGRLLRFYRDKLPFGTVQIGRSYRNEISPRQGMIRLREFTQAEAEIFVHPEMKDHPNFARYADYAFPLLSSEQQLGGLEAKTYTMKDAVAAGVIANEYVAYYLALTHELLVTIGVMPSRLRFRQHLPDERAHYAEDCWDAEIFSERFGWVETVGIADRTDYDLKAHAEQSGDSFTAYIQYDEPRREKRRVINANMGVLGPKYRGKAKAISDALQEVTPGPDGATVIIDGEEIFVPADLYEVKEEEVDVRGVDVRPHVIEPSYGIDRMIYAVLEHSYFEEEVEGEVRKVMRFPSRVAPVQVAIFPLMARDGLDVMAKEIARTLQMQGILAEYDDSGAIGRRYRRQDEIGTPFAVTVDYDSLEDQTVTLRDRDSMQQVRIPKDQLVDLIPALIRGKSSFSSLI